MLILSRKIDESLFIDVGGRRVEVMVTEIRQHRVKIGIVADNDVIVQRAELKDGQIKIFTEDQPCRE
jgi:carbon storage regulator CsrA